MTDNDTLCISDESENLTMSLQDVDNKDDDDQSQTDSQPLQTKDEKYASRLKSVTLNFLPLGFFAFGGPACYAILHERFVESNQWLDDNLFLEYLALCQALPGPSATQLVIAVAFHYSGYLGGLIAFFLWNLPCFIISSLVGLGINELNMSEEPDWMSGLAPSAISLVFIAAFKLGNKSIFQNTKLILNDKQNKQKFNILLLITILSAIIILFVTSIKEEILNNQTKGFVYPFVIFGGGICTLCDSLIPFRSDIYKEFRKSDVTLSINNSDGNKSGKIRCTMLISVWLIILAVLVSLRYETDELHNSMWLLIESFWRTGSIVYGGGQVILPMLFGEVVDTGWVSEDQFWTGYALSQILPGPLSCKIAAYIGALTYGIFGAFVGWVALFGPGMLLLFAFLPIMTIFKKWIWFQIMMEGINCAAIGLLVSACIKLWSSAVSTVADSCVVLIAGSLVAFWKIPTPIAIIIGGFVGFMFSDTVFGIGQKEL